MSELFGHVQRTAAAVRHQPASMAAQQPPPRRSYPGRHACIRDEPALPSFHSDTYLVIDRMVTILLSANKSGRDLFL